MTAPEGVEPQRLDRFISTHPEVHSRSRATHLIDDERVTVNGKVRKASFLVSALDVIEISLPPPKATGLIPYDLKLEILHEDEDVLVLDKPAGLVVHPAAGHEQDTLVNALVAHSKDFAMKFSEQRPGIVHRLDKDTSGIMVVTKNDFSHENLAQQFKKRSVHRIYYAAVHGIPTRQDGRIQSYLARHPVDRKKYASLRNSSRQVIREEQDPPPYVGKWAATDYQTIKSFAGAVSLLKLKLQTGRTHQIRVHLSEMGHSVLADPIYGKTQQYPKSFTPVIQKIPRLSLHAAELGFIHPKTGKELFFKRDWPEDLKPIMLEMGFNIP